MHNTEGGSLEKTLGKWLWEYSIYPVDKKQRELTESILLPNQELIAQELLRIREDIDAKIKRLLRKQKHRTLAHHRYDPSIADPASYPKGYCTLIRDGVWNDLLDNLGNPTMPGIRTLRRFTKKGGVIKRISGIQRGIFFQNAIQAGSLYVDVANDTVDVSKPPIEVCSLAESEFENVDDLELCGDVLESYWQHAVFPNNFFPNIAPFYPIVTVAPDGTLEFPSLNRSIMAMNVLSEFQPAEDFLFRSRFSDAELPPEYHNLIEKHFHQDGSSIATFFKGGASPEVLAGIFANLRKPGGKESLLGLIDEADDVVGKLNILELRCRAWSG